MITLELNEILSIIGFVFTIGFILGVLVGYPNGLLKKNEEEGANQ